MRHTIRPFITEYKSRSPKSQASRKWDIPEPESVSLSPSPVEVSVPVAPPRERDDGYRAALEAADALFSAKPIEPIAAPAPSAAPTGRILLSLLEAEAPVAAPTGKAPKRARQPRVSIDADTPREPAKKAPKRTQAIAKSFVERPAKESAAEIELVPTTRRERSNIQDRWVRKTELKSGEKWKRRLCAAAR